MRMAEVTDALRSTVPGLSSLFHDVLQISDIDVSGGVATVTTSGRHGLRQGWDIVLSNVETRTPIASVSQNGLQFTFTTTVDHDLTFGWPEHANVSFLGFTDPAWNASHKVTAVANRRTFTVQSANAIPVLTAAERLLEIDRIDGLNGKKVITSASTTTLTFDAPSALPGTYTPVAGFVSSGPRIYYVGTVERAEEIFAQNPEAGFRMFAISGDTVTSKDRDTENDGIANRPRGSDLRLQALDNFSVFVFAPTQNSLDAAEEIDICRHDLVPVIYRALYGRFIGDSGLCATPNYATIPLGHGVFAYRKAYVIYRYDFQVPVEYVSGDGVLPKGTRAFRDTNLTTQVDPSVDVTDLTVLPINLDEVDL